VRVKLLGVAEVPGADESIWRRHAALSAGRVLTDLMEGLCRAHALLGVPIQRIAASESGGRGRVATVPLGPTRELLQSKLFRVASAPLTTHRSNDAHP
jgi:hypothetical protein